MSGSSTARGSGNGIGIATLLGLAFVILKLCGVIAWPWIWVVAPFWIPVAFILGVLFVALVISVVKGVKS